MRIKFIALLLIISPIFFSAIPPLPTLFVIGDSISFHYGPFLKKYLEGHFIVDSKKDNGETAKNLDVPVGGNSGNSHMVVEFLKTKFKDPNFKPDYLLLNCGLHDIKHNPPNGKMEVDEKEYRDNLTTIVKMLNDREIKLIWVRTTPVVDSIHNRHVNPSTGFLRYAVDVDKYNQIADEICKKNSVPEIDLFSFTRQLGNGQFQDHVHYKEPARALQAAYIAGFIQNYVDRINHK
ncbi:MAG: SGNH/GDSL hydrolase family protein [Bacteroidota bacterium]